MPEYKSNKKRKTEESSGAEKLDIPSAKIESRCSVCQHESRAAIDGLIARGTAYAEIERLFGVNARSVNRHADRHLNYEDAAIQEIIRREAEKLGESYEQGVQGALSRRVYLETALKKAQEDLMNGSIIVEPKDAVNVVALWTAWTTTPTLPRSKRSRSSSTLSCRLFVRTFLPKTKRKLPRGQKRLLS